MAAEAAARAGIEAAPDLTIRHDRAYVRRFGLHGFVETCWGQLEPGAFVDGWHIEEMCRHLEAVTRGQIKRLIINVPPGFSKSLIVSVFWPLWTWIEDAGKKWIFASYDLGLAWRDARKMRNVLLSQWWHDRWPHVFLPPTESKAVSVFDNNRGGFRFSTSVAGPVTGRHAHVQVVDDPHKPLDLDGLQPSEKKIEMAINWWRGTMATRTADPQSMARVIIMQRLHERDLTGAMLDGAREGGEQYEHLCLPMRYEPERRCKTAIGGDRRDVVGQLLWPARFDEPAVASLEAGLVTERNKAAQLQQKPVPAGGNIIKTGWIKHWGLPGSEVNELPPIEDMMIMMSWDCRFKTEDTGSFVVGQVWGIHHMIRFFLLDQVRDRWGFTETLREFEKLWTKWRTAWVKLVENKANGAALANVLQGRIPGIELDNPDGTKEERLQACEPLFEAGAVFLPPPGPAYPWVDGYVHELTSFPAAANDDQVDATSQILKRFAKGSRLKELMAANQAMRGR